MRLLILFAVVAAASATFPKMQYYIKNLWGCKGEGEKSHSKCNQFLYVDSDAYVSLNSKKTKFEISPLAGWSNLYLVYIWAGKQKKYLSYKSRVSTWVVVDEKDDYMHWEIKPRGKGYSLVSKYNCPSWPCNQELTSGNENEKFLWLEKGYYHDFNLIPSE